MALNRALSRRGRVAGLAAAVVGAPAAAAVTVAAFQAPPSAPPVGAGLAKRFAPILRLAAGEEFRPITRRGYVTKTELHLVLRRKRLGIPLRARSGLIDGYPTERSLPHQSLSCPTGFSDCHYYLKVVGGDPRLGPAAYALVQAQLRHLGDRTTVYWHFDERHSTLQYWFFYAFNDFINRHEGDWEQITILLGPPPDYDALEVGYSSHHSGEAKLWGQIPAGEGRSDDRVLVYVARGSHANYFDTKPHRVIRRCPRLIPKCLERNGGDGERIVSYELAPIDWRPYVGDYGPGNYIPHLGHWAIATRKLTVWDPPARQTEDWTNPRCWLSRARPADALTKEQRRALQDFNEESCPEAQVRE